MSNEDFSFILGADDADEAWSEVSRHCSHLLYTANKKGVFVRSPDLKATFPVKTIDPVSTIGAGDNFNAGVVYSLYTLGITYDALPALTPGDWENIVATAVEFATHVCLNYDNYISEEFALTYRK